MPRPPERSPETRRVAVLGASNSQDRFSNRAIRCLKQAGYPVIPVNPNLDEVDGLPCVPSLGEIEGEVDTVTVYVSPERSAPMSDDLVGLRPRRVVFNPGAENRKLACLLEQNGITTVEACTLVMLDAGSF